MPSAGKKQNPHSTCLAVPRQCVPVRDLVWVSRLRLDKTGGSQSLPASQVAMLARDWGERDTPVRAWSVYCSPQSSLQSRCPRSSLTSPHSSLAVPRCPSLSLAPVSLSLAVPRCASLQSRCASLQSHCPSLQSHCPSLQSRCPLSSLAVLAVSPSSLASPSLTVCLGSARRVTLLTYVPRILSVLVAMYLYGESVRSSIR